MTINTRAVFAIAALSGLLSVPASSQPQPPPPPPEDRAPADDDAPGLRTRLQEHLNDISEEQDRLRKAIDMLDKGASPEDVKRDLSLQRPENERPRYRGRDPRQDGDRGDDARPRRGPDDFDGRHDGDGPDFHDPAQKERTLAFLRENLPEASARFEKFRSSNPEIADRIAARVGPRVREIVDLRERDPDLAELKLAELGNGLAIINAFSEARSAKTDAEKQAARQVLVARVGDQFDIRAKLRARDILRLRKRLDKLQADLEAQAARRDDDIQSRTDDLMSGKAPMDLFGDGPGKGPRGGHDRPDGSPGPGRPHGDKPPPPPEPK